MRSLILSMFMLLLALGGCCSVNRMSLRVIGSDSDAPVDAGHVTEVVGDAIKQMGFRRRDERILHSDLTIYSLTPEMDRDDLINVIVDNQTLTITLVEYRQHKSSLVEQIRKSLENQITDAYHIAVRFKELPCPSPWP